MPTTSGVKPRAGSLSAIRSRDSVTPTISSTYQSLAPQHALQLKERAGDPASRKVHQDQARDVRESIAALLGQYRDSPEAIATLKDASLMNNVLICRRTAAR